MRRTVLVLIILLTVVGSASLQADPSWTITSATLLDIPDGAPPHHVIPAPDGRHFAYGERDDDGANSVCSYDAVEGSTGCIPLPPELDEYIQYGDPLLGAVWSPDSSLLALVGNPVIRFEDTDLLVVDFADAQIRNLAQDDYIGSFISQDSESLRGVIFDLQPRWSPDGSTILVERSIANGVGGFEPPELVLVDVETGETESLIPIADMVGEEAVPGSILDAAWSPDGSTIAISLDQPGDETVSDGIWRIDVASGEALQIVTRSQAITALEVVYGSISERDAGFINLLGLDWSPDGERLLFWAADIAGVGELFWALWADADDGALTPLNIGQENGSPRISMRPWQATWTPDGETLLVVVRDLLIPMPEEDIPLIVPEAEDGNIVLLRWVSVPNNEQSLIGALPTPILSWPFRMTWSDENRVYASLYMLEMSPE